jgi:glycerate kinase
MKHANVPRKVSFAAILAGGLGIAALIAAASFGVGSRQATALPAYSQQTKLGCGSCHVNRAGGGQLKALGKKFQANGHKLK